MKSSFTFTIYFLSPHLWVKEVEETMSDFLKFVLRLSVLIIQREPTLRITCSSKILQKVVVCVLLRVLWINRAKRMAANFPYLMKTIHLHIQGQQIPSRITSKTHTQTYHCKNDKIQRKIWNHQEKNVMDVVMYKGIPVRLAADFSSETMEGRRPLSWFSNATSINHRSTELQPQYRTSTYVFTIPASFPRQGNQWLHVTQSWRQMQKQLPVSWQLVQGTILHLFRPNRHHRSFYIST